MFNFSILLNMILDGIQTLFFDTRSHSTRYEDSIKSQPKSFFKKRFVKKGAFAIFFAYMITALMNLARQIAQLSLSNPYKIALLSTVCPPILNTLTYALAIGYMLINLIKIASQKNPHNDDAAQALEWNKEWRIQMSTTCITIAGCALLLAASLLPIPGASNILGLVILSSLLVMDMTKDIFKFFKTRARQRRENSSHFDNKATSLNSSSSQDSKRNASNPHKPSIFAIFFKTKQSNTTGVPKK